MRRVSLIPPDAVDSTTKVLTQREVGFAQEIDGLSDLAILAVNFDIAPAVFKENIRRKANLQSTDWLIYDFDDGTPSARIHQILGGDNYRQWKLNHLLVGSKNHLRDKGDGRGAIERFHIFIPLRTPITDAEFYSFLWIEFVRLLLSGLNPDPACKDVTRYLAKHSTVLFTYETGMDLPLDMFRRLDELRRALKTQRLETRNIQVKARHSHDDYVWQPGETAIDRFCRTYAFPILRDQMSKNGNRYGNSQKIIGVMIKCGLTLDEGLALFDQHATYGKSFTRASVERMFRQFGGG